MISYRRDKFYLWLKHKVYKVPDGTIPPNSLLFIKALLFPFEYYKYRIFHYGMFGYHVDWLRDCLVDSKGNTASMMSILNYIDGLMDEYSKHE